MKTTLNLFYEEPNPDRWFKYDRYPRKLIRRIYRGKFKPGGQMMVALQLMQGLGKLGISCRFNDFKYAKQHPNELIGIIGKPNVLYENNFSNPILFGASVFSHPLDCPDLLIKYPSIKKILVPGNWMKEMFEPFYPGKVESWPVGIDTAKWNPTLKSTSQFDFLIYDKIRWDHKIYSENLIGPIEEELQKKGYTFRKIVYGHYNHQMLVDYLSQCKAVIFLCEHETQGLAYQQILATGTPIIAWDREQFWVDPYYYPDRVKYQPVSSVPYWDKRCGLKFKTSEDFGKVLDSFIAKINEFDPRAYIVENLTLEKAAESYYNIYMNLVIEQHTNS